MAKTHARSDTIGPPMQRPSGNSAAVVVPAVVLLQAAAWCLLVYVFHVRHLWYGFFDLSDIGVYRDFAELFARGQAPYRNVLVEYPPLALPLMVLPTKLAWLGGYDWAFAVEMMVLGTAAAVVTALAAGRWWPRSHAPLRAGVAFTIAVLLAGPIVANRFDIVVALDLALFAYLLARRWWWPAAAALGLGFALKLTPAVFLPVVFLLASRRRSLVYSAVAFVVAAALPFLHHLAGGGARGLLYVFIYHSHRPLQIESLLASGYLLGHLLAMGRVTVANSHGSQVVMAPGTATLAALSPWLLVAGLGVLYLFVWRRRQYLRERPADVVPVLLAIVLLLACASKVLSPQFLVWTSPLVALVMAGGGRGRLALGLGLLAVLLLTQVGFPRLYGDLVALKPGPVVLIVVRNVALFVVGVGAVLAVRKLPRHTEPARPSPATSVGVARTHGLVIAAAAAIRRGEIVAFPTETYYGLAVDAGNEAALERLFLLKGRSAEKASALLVADLAMFARLCAGIPERARSLAARHWPGPLTIALPARPGLPSAIVSEGFVAARASSHPIAAALVAAVGGPITCTSANPAGAAPPRTAGEVAARFPGGSFFLVDGGPTSGGPPSTLVRVRGDAVEILRRGAISL